MEPARPRISLSVWKDRLLRNRRNHLWMPLQRRRKSMAGSPKRSNPPFAPLHFGLAFFSPFLFSISSIGGRQVYAKDRTLIYFAIHLNATPVAFNDRIYKCQPQARPFGVFRVLGMQPLKSVENIGQLLFGNPPALVLYTHNGMVFMNAKRAENSGVRRTIFDGII